MKVIALLRSDRRGRAVTPFLRRVRHAKVFPTVCACGCNAVVRGHGEVVGGAEGMPVCYESASRAVRHDPCRLIPQRVRSLRMSGSAQQVIRVTRPRDGKPVVVLSRPLVW